MTLDSDPPDTIRDPDLVRELDRAEEAFDEAVNKLARPSRSQGRQALDKAVQVWNSVKDRYKDMGVYDAQWRPDFEAIDDAIQHAASAFSRQEPDQAVINHVRSALDTLSGLRDRSGLANPGEHLDDVDDTLSSLRRAVENVSEQELKSQNKVDQLRGQVEDARNRWGAFQQEASDRNAVDISVIQRQRLERMMGRIEDGLDDLDSQLASGERRTIVRQLNQVGRLLDTVKRIVGA